MKKFRIAAFIALVMSVFCLSGCQRMAELLKEDSQGKWCARQITYKNQAANVFFYFSEKSTTVSGHTFKPGLTIVVANTQASDTKVFGVDVTENKALYAVKTFELNETLPLGKKSAKSFVVNSSAWMVAYQLFDSKSNNVSVPACLNSGAYKNVAELKEYADVQFWKELLAEKLVDFLLGIN